ncbi:NUDIX hydrolase [Candidatus Uhrbacteria bacterium]|nr:NUDIX hydrolase [Candidatus Uhrbacteria bacterium]
MPLIYLLRLPSGFFCVTIYLNMKPQVLSSEIVHENPWYKIRHDKLVWTNGKAGEYFVVECPPVVVIMCEQDKKFLTVNLYRYPIDRNSIEFPTGGTKKNETPIEGAKRELKEETGYQASEWKEIGLFTSFNGMAHTEIHVFIASGLTRGECVLDDAESDMTHIWMPVDEWRAKIRTGEIIDSESLAAWAMYQEKKSK